MRNKGLQETDAENSLGGSEGVIWLHFTPNYRPEAQWRLGQGMRIDIIDLVGAKNSTRFSISHDLQDLYSEGRNLIPPQDDRPGLQEIIRRGLGNNKPRVYLVQGTVNYNR
jgi:hypothetical protein